MTLTGTDFGSNTTNTEILIDDIEQTIISASDTEIRVQITSMLNQFTRNIDVYLPIGIPDGLDDLTMNTGINLTAKFISSAPQYGSWAGSQITAQVRGIGTKTTGVTLMAGSVDICETVTIPSYGVVVCKTKAANYTTTSLRVQVGAQTYPCLGVNGECNYETDLTLPSTTDVTK